MGTEAVGLEVELRVGLRVRSGIALVGVDVAIVVVGDEVNVTSMAVGLEVACGPLCIRE
jgi:hypothetical protein